jgi:hypothetical protein
MTNVQTSHVTATHGHTPHRRLRGALLPPPLRYHQRSAAIPQALVPPSMRALTALVLLECGLHATCVQPPLARMMQASEQALVNEGLEEGREEKVCFDVGGRTCWCRVPPEAAATLCDGEPCWTPWARPRAGGSLPGDGASNRRRPRPHTK